jgi:hypothetical protein
MHEYESARGFFRQLEHLVQLVAHSLRRDALEQPDVTPHIRPRLFLDREVEPRHELNTAQNPQRILQKRVPAVDPEKPLLEIGPSAERINEEVRPEMQGHRIDGEVAPLEILLHREMRIEPHAEVPMGDSRGELRARERDVDRALRRRSELDDAERFSDEVHAPEPFETRHEIIILDPRDEVVLVGGSRAGAAEDLPHRPPDEVEIADLEKMPLPCVLLAAGIERSW